MVGGAQTLPETVAHDLILQVFITNNTTTADKSLSIISSPMANVNGQLLGYQTYLHWL